MCAPRVAWYKPESRTTHPPASSTAASARNRRSARWFSPTANSGVDSSHSSPSLPAYTAVLLVNTKPPVPSHAFRAARTSAA